MLESLPATILHWVFAFAFIGAGLLGYRFR